MAERTTDPDTFQALWREIVSVKERTDTIMGHVIRLDGTIGSPEQRVAGKFSGDPMIIIPATGICQTLERLAKDNQRANEELRRENTKANTSRTKKSMFASGTMAALVVLVTEGLRAWNHAAVAAPPSPPPAYALPSGKEAPK